MSDYTCPFCQSTDLRKVDWQIPDGDELPIEVDALECNQCYAGAPLSAFQKVSGWIPVSEQLPPVATAVLVWLVDSSFDTEGNSDLAEYTLMEEFILIGMKTAVRLNEVSHWMALPEQPRG